MSSLEENQQWENNDFNEDERDLEEALSLSDLPITTFTAGNEEDEAKFEEEPQNVEEDTDFDFAFGSLVESKSELNGEMCAADEVFSGGQILPYRNSVSSMTELRSFSRSESMDRRGFGSRSNNSSRSSSIRSHYSATSSSSGSSNCSNNTAISAKTVPLISKVKVQNQFHSYPSPKPQILGPSTRGSTHASPIGKKSKMWEVLKLGLVRTPEIELQDLKIRHHRKNNIGQSLSFPRNNSISSSNNSNNNNNRNYNDGARKSFSNEGHRISDFVLEMQRRKSQQQSSINKNGGFFKSCKCSIGAIDPLPTRPNYYGNKSTSSYVGISLNKQANSQHNSSTNEDKKSAQKKEEKQEEHKRNSQIRQDKQVMSHQNRTFEWLKNLSHASVLNS